MRTEYQKMIDNEVYQPWDKDLQAMRDRAHELVREYNRTRDRAVLKDLFRAEAENLYIEAPFYCDYGCNIELGKNVYMNFNCTILDCAKIKFGNNVFMAIIRFSGRMYKFIRRAIRLMQKQEIKP